MGKGEGNVLAAKLTFVVNSVNFQGGIFEIARMSHRASRDVNFDHCVKRKYLFLLNIVFK